MARNANQLGAMFKWKGFTFHKTLFAHAHECGNGPGDSSLGWPYERCPLENVCIWVIDEIGTASIDIFAKLFAALTVCGSLKKVILCGDHEQLPSIKTGDLARDLFKFLHRRSATVVFEHVHRVNEGARLLAENADAVRCALPRNVKFDPPICTLYRFNQRGKNAAVLAAEFVCAVVQQQQLKEYEYHVIVYENSWKSAINARLTSSKCVNTPLLK